MKNPLLLLLLCATTLWSQPTETVPWHTAENSEILDYDYCWHWQKPLPQGNHIWDIFFINNQTGWAVTWGGTILKTNNGGSSWTEQNSGTIQDLTEVQFIDDQTGWIVGLGGTILKTTDGGETWQSQVPPTSVNLFDAHFTDLQTGWAVGEYGTILKTSDGGITWQTQNSGLTTQMLFGVYFIDNQTGWAVGWHGVIRKTTDGGMTWQSAYTGSVNNYFQTVFFTESQTGWVATSNGDILKTTNGGATWQNQLSATVYGIWELQFLDNQTGWAVGEQGSILKTTDGGSTWQLLTQNIFRLLFSVHFTDSQTGWAAGVYGQIYRTTDGGLSWENQAKMYEKSLRGIHFTDSQTGWAVGDSGTILTTNTAGLVWENQISNTAEPLYDVFFPDSQTGWAIGGHGTILKTSNSGSNWASQNANLNNYLYTLFFLDNQTGWVAGEAGLILKTTNGGADWQSQPSGTNKGIYAIHFHTEQIGWAVGANGTILKTADGGSSWTSQNSGTTYRLSGVYALDSLTAWIVGSYGRLLHTTNGGLTWQTQIIGPYTHLEEIQFIDSETGWFCGTEGNIWMTTNGGTTWEDQSIYNSVHLFDIHFIDEENGWATLDGGRIVKFGTIPIPLVQDVALCKDAPAEALSAIGSSLLWYDTPTGGTGSSIAPIPNTSNVGSTVYYVSQSPIGFGNCGESARATITVTVDGPTAQVTTTGSCNNNGTLAVAIQGGAAPYAIAWSDGATTDTIENLAPGAFDVTIVDANGCTSQATGIIAELPLPTIAAINPSPACTDQSNGSFTAIVTGGEPPYTYLWSNGAQTETASNLPAGNYAVTVTGNNGCTTTSSMVLTEIPVFGIGLATNLEAGGLACQSTANPAAGTPPFLYQWSNGQQTQTADNLPDGSFSVTVTDALGCTAVQSDLCMTLHTTSIETIELFEVKPNPATDYVSVEILQKNPQELRISLYNSIGQELFTAMHNSKFVQTQIDVSPYPRGCYVLQISTDEGYLSEIIVIE